MSQPLAYIHPEAVIGKEVIIDPFASISKDVIIGDGSWIGSNVTIMDGARIGKNVKIFPGAVISAVPQDLKFDGETTTVEIGDNSVIRECATINRGTKDRFRTVIGANCLLMAYVHIAHDCLLGDYVILANSVQMAGHVVVGDHAFIGGTSAVHQFTKIGTHAMIAGGSLVRQDVPPYALAGREPLSYCGVNATGLRRKNFTNDKIGEIQEIYKRIYFKGINNSKALEMIEQEIGQSQERDIIMDFVKNSDRGIMKGSLRN